MYNRDKYDRDRGHSGGGSGSSSSRGGGGSRDYDRDRDRGGGRSERDSGRGGYDRYGSSGERRDGGGGGGYKENRNPRHDSYHGNGFSGGDQFNPAKRTYDIELNKPTWSPANMAPFERDFYRETPEAAKRSEREIDEFLKKHGVEFKTDRRIRPVLDFNDFSIPDTILSQFRKANYDKPTPIQATCWPTLMSGQNIVGIAQTGSGKTLGFLLPILIHIQNNQRYLRTFGRDDPPGPIALVLAPTRELAQQIQKVADDFGTLIGLKNACLYGGAAKGFQIKQISRNPEICIATPGRLLDLLNEKHVSLKKCTFLVLDEADRMLDMGFEPQIRKVMEQIRPDRQIAMFSATWPREVRRLAEDFLDTYSQVTIGTAELTVNPNIKQIVEVCQNYEKEHRLKEILREVMNEKDAKAIIFAETKRRVDSFYEYIRDLGYFCMSIHGDKKQQERDWALNEFKLKSKSILIATDVAARGLDVSDIKVVINIDFPNQVEDYIHRIGRTGRGNKTGTSITFVTYDNARHVPKLVEVLREANQVVSEQLMSMSGGQGRFGGNQRYGGGQGRFSRDTYGGQKRSRDEDDHWSGDTGKRGRWDVETRVSPNGVVPLPVYPPAPVYQAAPNYSSAGPRSSTSPNTPPGTTYNAPHGQAYYPPPR